MSRDVPPNEFYLCLCDLTETDPKTEPYIGLFKDIVHGKARPIGTMARRSFEMGKFFLSRYATDAALFSQATKGFKNSNIRYFRHWLAENKLLVPTIRNKEIKK